MDTQKDQSMLNEDIFQDTSGERKIYPITEEILEAGERAFHRAVEEERARAKAEKTDLLEEFILTPSSPDEQPETADLTLECMNINKVEEVTFEGEEDAEARIEEAMKAYDKAMDEAAGIDK